MMKSVTPQHAFQLAEAAMCIKIPVDPPHMLTISKKEQQRDTTRLNFPGSTDQERQGCCFLFLYALYLPKVQEAD
jgi:hypothetical protein